MFKNNILHESVQALVEELIPKFYLTHEMSAKRLYRNEKATGAAASQPI
ncbi:hypothetical protein J7E70_05860 [Variovorax paradoxus]|nr:hypothetical protein [Variovorax paradoxus]MBT2299985.1 hypothetical protein [Variovorax paradoxus]